MSPSSAISNDDTTPTNTDVSGVASEQLNGPRSVVHLGTIAANYRALCDLCSTSETGAVVKADAYGHGAAEVAAKLAAEGCETFFIAYPREGEAVRIAVGPDKRIFVFHGLTNDSPELIIQHDLMPICNRVEEVKLWLEAHPDRPYGLHFDTGINRLGLRLSDLAEVKGLTSGTPPVLVMSHLACADQPEHAMNAQQLQKFREVVAAFPESKASLSATAASYLGPDYHFDLIRPGIALYGGGP
ncbi:MAG TPA: alanine racemase, partial [Hyphomonadaceae bacterium]|nr:alanine racemase [Hyphomonadaceae bacterium]